MCGICGFVNLDGKAVDHSFITRMNDALYHRGPDDDGVRVAGNTAIAMRRLSIIDPEGGHQPISNESGEVWTVFNGEIYNATPLREALKKSGHKFTTSTDTEVIVHQYEESETKAISELRGMFAFAVHDVRGGSNSLLIARDRVGIKPLYYYRDEKLLAFSSELSSLLQHPGIRRQVNPVALNQYLATGIVSSPITMFKNVFQLMPGHYLLLQQDQIAIESYWTVPEETRNDIEFDEAVYQTRALLEESVKEHIISDVPIGAFLSGGIDSSSVVALMANQSSKPISTFSIRFQGNDYDESGFARMMSDRYETDHHEFNIPDNAFSEELLRGMISHHGQPTADSSALPTYIVSNLARKHVKVALSGDGGDECFAGYSHYGWLKRISRLKSVPGALRGFVHSVIQHGANNTLLRNHSVLRAVKNAIEVSLADKASMPLEVLRLNNPDDIKTLLTAEWQVSEADTWNVMQDSLLNSPDDMDDVAKAQRFSFRYFLPDAYLPKVDRMSMAASLEVRVPFLDHRLVEYALSLPGKMHWDGGKGKKILRAAVHDLLPDEIFSHKKQGFSIPLHTWVDDSYYDLVDELLNERQVARRGFFNINAVRNLIDRCRNGEVNLTLESEYRQSHRLYQLVVLELWCRMFIDEVPARPSLAGFDYEI